MKTNLSVHGCLIVIFSFCLLPLTDVASAQEAGHHQVDLIIKGDHIVTMDADGTVYRDAAVAVDEGLIVAIGPASEILAAYQPDKLLEGNNRVVMPGLVNGHSHAAMTLLRGIAEDMALLDWLTTYIFPAELEFVDADFVGCPYTLKSSSDCHFDIEGPNSCFPLSVGSSGHTATAQSSTSAET